MQPAIHSFQPFAAPHLGRQDIKSRGIEKTKWHFLSLKEDPSNLTNPS